MSIDPQDIDPDTGKPYSNYSTPSLDTSFHDAEVSFEEKCRCAYVSTGGIGMGYVLYRCMKCGDEYEKDVS
jgi:hypothetical protein